MISAPSERIPPCLRQPNFVELDGHAPGPVHPCTFAKDKKACQKKLNPKGPLIGRANVARFLYDVSGAADVVACAKGKTASCVLIASGPVGRGVKVTRVVRAASRAKKATVVLRGGRWMTPEEFARLEIQEVQKHVPWVGGCNGERSPR